MEGTSKKVHLSSRTSFIWEIRTENIVHCSKERENRFRRCLSGRGRTSEGKRKVTKTQMKMTRKKQMRKRKKRKMNSIKVKIILMNTPINICFIYQYHLFKSLVRMNCFLINCSQERIYKNVLLIQQTMFFDRIL